MSLNIEINEISNKPKTQYEKYKEYRKLWNSNNRDKINSYAKEQYRKTIESNPEVRKILNDRALTRYNLNRVVLGEEREEEKKKRGRPKTKPQIEKKANGRPRKYL